MSKQFIAALGMSALWIFTPAAAFAGSPPDSHDKAASGNLSFEQIQDAANALEDFMSDVGAYGDDDDRAQAEKITHSSYAPGMVAQLQAEGKKHPPIDPQKALAGLAGIENALENAFKQEAISNLMAVGCDGYFRNSQSRKYDDIATGCEIFLNWTALNHRERLSKLNLK